ncbi:MAG: alpha/beta hydrolase [Candidatus Eremiobacteraeota bacterium]|nr:alpha/beta hydrolase [Candidatus Eremiobacteraeota bacterium]
MTCRNLAPLSASIQRRLFVAAAGGAMLGWLSPADAAVRSVVLVHGAFADGSGWRPAADILQSDGYSVYVVQEPETSVEADVAATRRVLDKAGASVLVGHSYAGLIISEGGMHPDVKALVYEAAFQPDIGENIATLAGRMPPASASVVPVGDDFLTVEPNAFPNDFAPDVPKPIARFMAISQVPASNETFTAKAAAAAWKDKPSYAVVAMQDRMINPDLERWMTKRALSQTIELSGSHGIFLSHPREVAALIEKAAEAN